jgi:hypothetical protein
LLEHRLRRIRLGCQLGRVDLDDGDHAPGNGAGHEGVQVGARGNWAVVEYGTVHVLDDQPARAVAGIRAGVAPVAAPRAYRDDGPGTSRVGDEVGVTDGDLLRAISAANLARLAGAGADWTRLSGDILLRTPARLRTFALRIDLQRLVPSIQSGSGLTAGDIVQLERV